MPTEPATSAVRLLVKGFTPVEHRLLEGTVKLSQRRPPRIDLVTDADFDSADVILLDAQQPAALEWAAARGGLAGRAAIWAGAKAVRTEHVAAERHIKWPILPVMLFRALEQAPRHGGQRAAAQPRSGRRVLVIDDSLAVRNHLRVLLERDGIEVHEAHDAEAGIAAAASTEFGCVLLDVLMPGMDGFEACRRLTARGRTAAPLPVVMLTSKSSPFDRVRGKMAGCDTYLTKPVDPEELRKVVNRHLGTDIALPLAA